MTAPVATPPTTSSTRITTVPPRSRIVAASARWLSLALVAATLAIGLSLATPHAADAAVSNCGNGRCTVYLSKSETRALGEGRIPAPPATLWWQLKAGYYTLAYAHRWFAQQYANRGLCSAFTVSINPAGTQGYYGYACNWN